MSRLMPPPQRDLPEADRREIHANLVRTAAPATSPRPRRRLVVVPALALAGVIGAVAAVGVNLPDGSGSTATGVPAPAGPVASGTATSNQTSGPTSIPPAETIDSGPLTISDEEKVIEGCLQGPPRGATAARVHLARQTSIAGPVVVLTDSDGIVHLCTEGTDVVGTVPEGDRPSRDPRRPSPTQRQPVVQLAGSTRTGSGAEKSGVVESTATSFYRVGPEVASVQVRLTVAGHAGPWVEAIVADGYAFAYATNDHPGTDDDHAPDAGTKTHLEDRAFDAAGRELGINRVR